MAKRTRKICFYCDCVFSASASSFGDHFPVPKRNGGIDCVPCCQSCHDLKDRTNIEDWNGIMLQKVTSDMPKLSRETRLFLAKAVMMFSDCQSQLQ